MGAADLYLDLYDAIVTDAEYLQADSQTRHLLPADLIVGALGAILGTFAQGFFGSLGQRASDAFAKKVATLFKKSEETRDAGTVVDALELLQPILPLLHQIAISERRAWEQSIAELLHDRGFPMRSAQQVSRDILEILYKLAAEDPSNEDKL